ncbi:hypothetical protein [Methylorubrum suomiense]|uniref:Uncharacterized protein n=1 Tax=Methylorubrum suomiense TaxID=144191 RepID=A0ABQ4V0K6_9HYPH|nr:hypothetical protein [Methylorubrum suomiense]GJE78120.1 hypothetical protein BGCPKDLD_4731 [Methylorubrum suomiense]
MTSRERIEPAEGHFYLVGLGILMQGVQFTPDEQYLLNHLCKHAARGDEEYLKAIRSVKADATASRLLERLKQTLRAMGKGPALEAYYDRAA